MSYGLKVTTGTSNTIIQIDSNIDMVNMPGVSQSASASVAYSPLPPAGPNLIFINKSVANGSFKAVVAWRDSNTIYFRERTNFFPQPQVSSAEKTMYTSTVSAAQSYVSMRDIAGTATGSPTGNYGLIVKNPSGTQTVFDSRYYTSTTYSVTSVIDIGGRLGAISPSNTDIPITTNLNAYVSIYPSNIATTSTISSTNWFLPTGLIFSNNHSTMGTGIYYYGIFPAPFGGYVQQYNQSPLLIVT